MELVRVGGDDDDYEEQVSSGSSLMTPVPDERGLVSINYTSGTTGAPKGVMYHHRGAYLQALGHGRPCRAHLERRLPVDSADVSLQRVVLHLVGDSGGGHPCLCPRVEPAEIWHQIDAEGVTALCGAPTMLTMIGYAPEAKPLPEGRRLRILTGGAPPTPAILSRMEELGGEVTHLYGLTETYGPVVVCEWHPAWDNLDADANARLRARQGVAKGSPTSAPTLSEC